MSGRMSVKCCPVPGAVNEDRLTARQAGARFQNMGHREDSQGFLQEENRSTTKKKEKKRKKRKKLHYATSEEASQFQPV